jgi:hypothetical protein
VSAATPVGWIEEVEELLAELHGQELEVFDDGEAYGDVYVFFIARANERTLLGAASRVAVLDRCRRARSRW